MNTKNNGVKERIYLTREAVQEIETKVSLELHIRRYGFVRQYAHGQVLDLACGAGYGAYMLQKNPDVSKVVGVDASEEAVEHAKKYFQTDKIEFICSPLEEFFYGCPFDMGVSLETIEHLKDPAQLVKAFQRNNTQKIIMSFPTKKSTHFNPYHLHDFKLNDINDLFLPHYEIYDTYEYFREFMFVFLQFKTG